MKIKKRQGISLTMLVIIIIIILILAGVSITFLTSYGGVVDNASYTKFATDIRNLEEQLELEQIFSDESFVGTVNEVLQTDSAYNELLYIENGKLVYISAKASRKEQKWLDKLGIEKMSDYFTVSFDSSGGTEISSQSIKSGKKANEPTNPIKDGYEFEGWYYLKGSGSGDNITYQETKFDFNTEILSDYSLYAKYANEAVMIPRNNNKAFWQTEYREKITSISFEKVDEINVPEGAESWQVNQDNTSEIIAYVISDGNSGLELHVVSKYEIFAPWYLARYFNNFTNLVSIDFRNFKTNRVGNCFHLFSGDTKLKEMNIELLETNIVNRMDYMFYNCSSLESINLSNFNTSNVTSMEGIFHTCSSLETLDVSNFDTKNVSRMDSMFKRCSTIENLNLNTLETENVTNMANMFEGNTNLKRLEISNFNTKNVTTMIAMFNGCSSLESLYLSNFDTSNVTSMQDMFRNTGLKSLDISNFNTEKVTTMYRMFENSTNLESVNLSGFDNSELTTLERMFYGCTNLKNVNLENFNTFQVTKITNMFARMYKY